MGADEAHGLRNGGIYRRQNARKVVSNDFEWFAMTVMADGPHLSTWVNGYQVAHWTDTRAPDVNPRGAAHGRWHAHH